MPSDSPKLQIVTVDARTVFDNYYFLIHDPESGKTAAVDCGGAEPVLKALEGAGWSLDEIWLTHHHWDHIDGVADLVAATGAKVRGSSHNTDRLPPLDFDVAPNGTFDFAGHAVHVIPVEGHANGHVAYHIPANHALFSGDSLMAMGCGRLLEGTAEQMWDSLQRLSALPRETIVYSGHEYTAGNCRFALTIEHTNPALRERVRAVEAELVEGKFTVPSPLALELETNPFLRAHLPSVKEAVDMADASDLEVFAEIRARKDRF